ncbi:MAG: PAS domain S-box protein [Candidatus Pacebacteria bacterium]|nr:PAS domain S-box protein [Candidatus Paceibacterota bacterium]MDD5752963.1 PAS domain S-box protein [Candidatus Paceibacterota bacterium]
MIFENQIKVLHVDDESDILELSKLFLEKRGMTVTTAMSPIEVMKLLKKEKFDIIISDYFMLEMNGMELFKKIRAKNNKIPFVLFTGKGCEGIAIDALNMGVNYYFLKDGQLKARLEELAKQIENIILKEQIQENLRKKEEKYRLLIDNSHDIIFLIDLNGILIFTSPSWQTLLGHSIENVVGKSFKEFVHPEDIEKCEKILSQRNQERLSIEYRVRRIDGTWRWHHTNGTTLTDEQGNVIGFEGSASDITEFKDLEHELKLSSKKLKLISSLTHHDILNHLMVISGYTELVSFTNLNKEQREYLNHIQDSEEAIKNQIEFVREYEKVGIGKPRWVNVSELVSITDNEKISLVNHCHHGLLVFADPMIEKIFLNLMDNTLRHSSKATEVHVYHEISENGLIIIWEDNGIGISRDKKEKIFSRGYGRNTGLGLFLIREVLMMTNITIRENGNLGKGARFEIFVPNSNYIIKED